MFDFIADRAYARGNTLVSRALAMPEGRLRALLILRAALWNGIRRLARPTDHAFIEGEQHG